MPNFLSDQQVMNFIHKIEASGDPYIDSEVLSTALKLAYLCGIKKAEIIALCIMDVRDTQGHILNEIAACSKTINGQRVRLLLSDPVKQILRDHLKHLRKYQYSLARKAPLFPQKNKRSYSESTLQEHLEKFRQPGVRLEKIRHAGIFRVYMALSASVVYTEIRLKRTAEYARTSKRYIERLIYGR